MGRYGRLRILDGIHAGSVFDLSGGENLLGRAPDAAVHLTDRTLSRRQASLRCDGHGVIIENLSARNPTHVNNVPVTRARSLRDGDRILAGTVNLVFEAAAKRAARPAKPAGAAPVKTIVASKASESMVRRAADRLQSQDARDPAGPSGTRMLSQPYLVLSFPGGVTRNHTLVGDELKVGRAADCEVMVDFPTVSSHHAVLREVGGKYEIADAGSTNGTFVNGIRIERGHPLADGDIVRIGDQSGNSVSLKYHVEGSDARNVLGTVAIGRLQVEGKDSFILGRDPGCDVPLDSSQVSWRHTRVDKEGGGHVITDLGSTNGTFVNGEPIRGREPLSTGDVISIGPHRFVYTSAGFSQSSAAGSVRVDGVKVRRVVGKGATTKVLLNDISITVQPREFVALVGGSGAGKSTLMKTFAGIYHHEGGVLINGENLRDHYDNWKTMMGYVPQDDIVHGDLTADEAVRYAGRLRLPKDTTSEELNKAIDRVLGDVEMLDHRDKIIRSLSGGQRKRVSIAVEMLSEPYLFFLDEPTSGLDPGLEKKMMYMMRKLADGGRTIMMVTHATANITQCDHVAFLSRGHLVWYGPPAEVLEHFSVQDFSDIYTKIEKDPEALSKKYRRSHAYTKYVVERQKALRGAEDKKSKSDGHRKTKKRSPGAIRQFGILTGRYWNLVMRDRLLLGILLAVMPVIGLMLSAMAKTQDLTGLTEDGIAAHFAAKFEPPDGATPEEFASYTVVDDAQKLLFMAALAVVMLGLFAAAYEVVKERPIYKRERMVNLGIGAYLMSKVLVLFAFSLLQCAALIGALMLFVDMPSEGVFFWAPGEMYVTLLLTALASILMGLFVSSLTPNSNAVIYMVLLVVFSQILLTGTIFDLPKHARPASFGMVTRWSLEALGSSVDMNDLDKKSEMRIKKTVEVDPNQLGDAVGPLLENAGLDLDPIPLDEAFATPIEPDLRYEHDKKHLEFLWYGLGGFSLAFLILTWITLAWRDRQED